MWYLQRNNYFLFYGIRLATVLLICAGAAYVQGFTSSSYTVREPVMNSGGYGTSANFKLFGSLSEIAVGTSTSLTFKMNAGFLYFPVASSPVASATAGNEQVALSWSASVGSLGWTVSGYHIGQSAVSGGPYAYSASLGNVTSSTRTGLANGTTYYFVVRAEDAFGNAIATSSQVAAVPVAPEPAPAPSPSPASSRGGGGGGGGGDALSLPTTAPKVILKGRAYPGVTVTVFKDGTTVAAPKADANGNFEISVSVAGGIYTFSLYAVDSENNRSLTSSFTTNVPSGSITTISDIVIAPTIGSDKSSVKSGNEIQFFGVAYPVSSVSVIINSDAPFADTTESDAFGRWSYVLNSTAWERGDHTIKSRATTPDGLISPFSESLAFIIGDQDVARWKRAERGIASVAIAPTVSACNKNGDINNDGKANIVDFSIMLFFWSQRNPKNPCADINRDGVVNLFDFSIMLFWWTG